MSVYIGQGTTLAVKKTGGEDYTIIAALTTVDGPSYTVGSIETTNLSSTRKTYRPGIPDAGELSGTLQFDAADAGHIYLQGLLEAPEVLSWQLSVPTLPKATLFTADGFPTAFAVKPGAIEDVVTADVTIKLTGEVVVTPAT